MFENIRLSFQGIWSHKLRSFLTMLGIIIGIAAIIAIVSTIEGTNELIKQNMMGNNRHTVKVQLSQDDYTYEISTWNPSPEGVPLFDEDTRQEILQIPNVLRAAFYQVRSEYNSVVFYNNQSLSSCTVLGIDQYYFGTAGYQIMQGREIIQEDSKKKRQVAVIDEAVLRTLFPDEDPIGKTIEIYGEPFTVVGVCTQVGQSELVINSEEEYWTYYQGGSSSGNIYIPKGVWGTIYKFDEAQNLVLQASGADEMAAAGKAAANIMNQNMNVSDSSITYRSEDLMQQAQQLLFACKKVSLQISRARDTSVLLVAHASGEQDDASYMNMLRRMIVIESLSLRSRMMYRYLLGMCALRHHDQRCVLEQLAWLERFAPKTCFPARLRAAISEAGGEQA